MLLGTIFARTVIIGGENTEQHNMDLLTLCSHMTVWKTFVLSDTQKLPCAIPAVPVALNDLIMVFS